MRTNDRFGWLFLAAAALAAMLAGHALELSLESTHAFGDQPANYGHTGQGYAAELSLLLLVAVAAAIARFIASRIRQRTASADALMPALHSIAGAGFSRIVVRLVGMQFLALFVVELWEQRLSGYQGNALLAIAGPGHASALVVHAVIGVLVAYAVFRFARFVSARTRIIIDAVIAFVRWAMVAPVKQAQSESKRVTAASVFCHHLSLIALGLAKRPPPATSAYLA